MTDTMVLEILLAAGLSIVFAVSGASKLWAGPRFVITVVDFRVVPRRTGVLFARLLPSVEIFGALAVVSGAAIRFGALLLVSLSLSFIYAISINLVRKRTLTCGCFGAGKSRIVGWDAVLQDVVLLGASALLAVLCSSWVGIEPWSPFRSVAWVAH